MKLSLWLLLSGLVLVGCGRGTQDDGQAESTPKWREVGSWRGNDKMTTQTFHVPTGKEWRLSYELMGAEGIHGQLGLNVLNIYVHKAGEEPSYFTDENPVTTQRLGGGETYCRTSGDIYLEILSVNSWVVKAEVQAR